MDVLQQVSPLKLDDPDWPIRSYHPNLPPARFYCEEATRRDIRVRNAIVCDGSTVAAADVLDSIVGFECDVRTGAVLDRSILLGNVTVGCDVQLRRTIVDKNTSIPAGSKIGFDTQVDRAAGFTVTEQGITVVPRGYRFDPGQRRDASLQKTPLQEATTKEMSNALPESLVIQG